MHMAAGKLEYQKNVLKDFRGVVWPSLRASKRPPLDMSGAWLPISFMASPDPEAGHKRDLSHIKWGLMMREFSWDP